jgi:hypothetical protein
MINRKNKILIVVFTFLFFVLNGSFILANSSTDCINCHNTEEDMCTVILVGKDASID